MPNMMTKPLRLLALACLVLLAPLARAALPIQHWTQPSGAKVYLVESRSIAMVDVQIDFDAGARRDLAGQAGLANLTAAMTSKGLQAAAGAPALDENQLGEAWADLGAGFGGGAGSDRMSFNLRSLSDPALLGRAADLAARQLGEPSFPEAIWRRDRQRIAAAIREANTQPATVAQRAFAAAVYGSHPYGQEPTEATLERIETEHMRAFHARHVQPCRAKVSIVGDLGRAQADALVTRLLARLPAGAGTCAALPVVPEVAALQAPALQAIAFQSAQAHVLIGQPGYRRSDPDFFPLLVGNYVLGGGGFVSRLSTEVREKRGLSYSVYSYFSPGLHAGAFTVGLQTRPDQASQAIAFQSAQAHVLIGQPGYRRSDPDFFPLLVGNYVLGGGGFVSRLSTEVREKRGLSYSVYSYFSPGLHAGAFTVGLQTRPDQASQAIQVVQEVVSRYVTEGPSEAELKAAKDNLVGGFALRIDSNRKLLDNVASIAWNELPLDYLDTWTAQVAKVTAAEVRAAMARKLQPERMVTVTVGAPVAR